MQTKEDVISTEDQKDFENLPIDVKAKLNDLIKKNDTIESIVKQFEFKSFKDFDLQVSMSFLKFSKYCF